MKFKVLKKRCNRLVMLMNLNSMNLTQSKEMNMRSLKKKISNLVKRFKAQEMNSKMLTLDLSKLIVSLKQIL